MAVILAAATSAVEMAAAIFEACHRERSASFQLQLAFFELELLPDEWAITIEWQATRLISLIPFRKVGQRASGDNLKTSS